MSPYCATWHELHRHAHDLIAASANLSSGCSVGFRSPLFPTNFIREAHRESNCKEKSRQIRIFKDRSSMPFKQNGQSQVKSLITNNAFFIVQRAAAQSKTGNFRGYGVAEASPGFQAGWSDCMHFSPSFCSFCLLIWR
jgi:hypothetical protein